MAELNIYYIIYQIIVPIIVRLKKGKDNQKVREKKENEKQR